MRLTPAGCQGLGAGAAVLASPTSSFFFHSSLSDFWCRGGGFGGKSPSGGAVQGDRRTGLDWGFIGQPWLWFLGDGWTAGGPWPPRLGHAAGIPRPRLARRGAAVPAPRCLSHGASTSRRGRKRCRERMVADSWGPRGRETRWCG
jgi:hypothetical protein